MPENSIIIEKVQIRSACDIDSSILSDYYRAVYSNRMSFLESNWRWLNRSSFLENKIPLVLVYDKRVIGHAGMIPVKISINDQTFSAAWFIDLSILPEYQRKGLGSILVKKRMELTDIQLSFPNDKSYPVFKKFGWNESFDSFLHYNFINLFSHPKIRRWLPGFLSRSLNRLSYAILVFFYKRYAASDIKDSLLPLNDELINAFLSEYDNSRKSNNHLVSPFRDREYLNWRIKGSPNSNNYRVYKSNDFSAFVFFNEKTHINIDILWVSDIHNKAEIRNMIASLAVYGRSEGYSYVRFYTSRNDVSEYLKKFTGSYVTHQKFVFNSMKLHEGIISEDLSWNLELIDSDFEFSAL